jgi:hypothetical protein
MTDLSGNGQGDKCMPLLSGALPISEVFYRLLKGLRAMGRVIPRITVQEFSDQRDRMVPA